MTPILSTLVILDKVFLMHYDLKNLKETNLNSNLFNFLKMYYHESSNKALFAVFLQDLLSTVLFIGGSGIFSNILRGFYYRILINYSYPALIGRGFKIINIRNFKAGKNIWIKDGVSILAGGKISLGDNCVICERTSIWSHKEGVKIDSNVAIGIGSYISGTGGAIEIGDEVRIADHVRMYSFNHNFSDPTKPISGQGYSRKGIVIEDNVWIGSGAIILDGVSIKKNSVVAAGSVVTKDVPKSVVVAGVPAKIIKKIS